MEYVCPICQCKTRLIIMPNGKVYEACSVCDWQKETKELAPNPTDDWRKNNED